MKNVKLIDLTMLDRGALFHNAAIVVAAQPLSFLAKSVRQATSR
jgi:hypothetical protein